MAMAMPALLVVLCACPAVAQAQAGPEPLPIMVVDVRAFSAGLGQDPVTASDLGVAATSLPGRALGGAAGISVYPFRRSNFAIGIGGEAILARATATQEDADGMPLGPPLEQRLRGIAGGISLNFGHRDGWSYLSAGMGPMSFGTFAGEQAPADAPPTRSTINMGGGARWFVNRHLGLTFDVRFYLTRPEVTGNGYAARQRNRLLVLSGGVSIK